MCVFVSQKKKRKKKVIVSHCLRKCVVCSTTCHTLPSKLPWLLSEVAECLCIRTCFPLPFVCVCVFVSQKKKKQKQRIGYALMLRYLLRLMQILNFLKGVVVDLRIGKYMGFIEYPWRLVMDPSWFQLWWFSRSIVDRPMKSWICYPFFLSFSLSLYLSLFELLLVCV